MEPDNSDVLYERTRTTVTREASPRGPVIRKTFRGPDAAARCRLERSVLQRLATVPGVPRLADRTAEVGATVTVVDTGHQSLADYVDEHRPDPLWLVRFARDLARVLAGVHAAGVLHRDLSPANVLVRPDGTNPVLTDYDLATTFAEDRPQFTHPSEIAGTLPYVSPERTGRTGHAVDQRADLYSLGAILYELATGGPPFGLGTDDPLELVHAHLAQAPVPPADLVPTVPPALSAIILRLLQKEPDHRYAGAEGLAHDLARLSDELAAGRDGSAVLPLGARDFPPRLAAPSRLIGRDAELAVLHRCFDGLLIPGSPRGLLLSGPAGVGKSALLDRLRAMVTVAGSGLFVTAKVDQYRHDRVTGVVTQALRGLGRLLLAEPEERVETDLVRLREVLGPNAGHLAALLPEFATLLRVTPQPADGDPAEVARRGRRAYADLLRTIAGPARPVVLVLDDLQWASGFALDALDAVLTDEDLDGVLVVGGFRAEEVGPAHPLTALAQRWERAGALHATLSLDNLPEADVSRFLAEMLRMPRPDAAELARLVTARTAGNPFDTVELVNALRREGVLTLADDGWRWDPVEVRRHVGAGDVLGLIDERVARLPEDTREMLRTMACLGNRVELTILNAVLDAPCGDGEEDAVGAACLPALEDGLVILEQGAAPALRFRHDRVQQAVYAELGTTRGQRHLALARRLAKGTDDLEPRAAEQYLTCAGELTDPAERAAVAVLFERAARRAVAVANHEVAERYLVHGIGLLGGHRDGDGSGADVDADLLRRLHAERHSTLYALGRLDAVDEEFGWLQAHCDDALSRGRAAVVQIAALTNRGMIGDAVLLGRTALAALGHPTPSGEELGPQIAQGLEDLRAWVATPDWPPSGGPECTDATLDVVGQLISRVVPATFFTRDPLLVWLVVEGWRLWQRHGASAALVGPLAHAAFATITAADDYRTGPAVVGWILAESAARGYEPAHSQALFLYSLSASPWLEPPRESLRQARAAREGLIRGGDVWNAGFTYFNSVHDALACAESLTEAEVEADAGLAFTERIGNGLTGAALLGYRQTARALQGRTAGPGLLDDDDFDTRTHLEAAGANQAAAMNFHLCAALVAAIFTDRPRLDRHADQLRPLLPYAQAAPAHASGHFWAAYALAARLRDAEAGSAQAAAVLAELDEHLGWLTARAEQAPANYDALCEHLRAERTWALGAHDEAAAHFDRACRTLPATGLPGHRALAVERYGRFELSRGKAFLGMQALQQALRLYADWGADGKVARLVEEFPGLEETAAGPGPGRPGTERPATERPGTMTSGRSLDLVAVLRAFQILGGETSPARLQDRVTEVLGLLAGATRARLVLRTDTGGWAVPADDPADEGRLVPVEQAATDGTVPMSVLSYALRTAQTLIVDDAAADARFAKDPYFAGVERCALLVTPIQARGGPVAVLLLENRLTRNAFSAQRLDIIELVAGELGICLDNLLAERFRSLVQRSAELTLVCDRSGQVSYASAAATALLGRPEADVVGRPLGELFTPEDRATVTALLDQAAPGSPTTATVRVAHPDGEPRWAEATFTDLTSDPAVGGVMVRVQDITQRHRLEIELRHAQKLESVGQLASGIAHEINTPMQFISSNLHFLDEAFTELVAALGSATDGEASAAADPAAVAELLEEIPAALSDSVEGADRVATIVRAMKTFGSGDDAKGWEDLNEIVRNTLLVAANELRPHADVVTDLAEIPRVWCHRGDLNQVLLNLVVNAAQAMADRAAEGGPRGTLTVRTRAEDGTGTGGTGDGTDGDPDGAVVVEVQDTGVGIPPEIGDRVFDQFFTTRPVGSGTGQGLALAYTLVRDRHDGRLTFTSTPGEGTTFTVRLPVRSS